jgi:hypothetical protein
MSNIKITYSWEILNVSTIKEPVNGDDYVCYVEWKKIGTDDLENTGEYIGSSNFLYHNNNKNIIPEIINLPGINKKIIPYKDLTKDIMISWLENEMSPFYKNLADKQISAQIEWKRYKRNDSPLPWNN